MLGFLSDLILPPTLFTGLLIHRNREVIASLVCTSTQKAKRDTEAGDSRRPTDGMDEKDTNAIAVPGLLFECCLPW